MAQHGGIRLLSLDGGGTRGLSTLYILRGLMGRAISSDGGCLRPCEYFDLIGGSGLTGLCALLFVRFCYTVDQAIEYLHDVSQKLDEVESFRIKVLGGAVDDAAEWQGRIREYDEPAEQLEALRAWIVDVSWEEVVKKNIVDGLERYLHMEDGKFNFKSPSAVIEAGRPKAFVVSSESQGYGPNGGFDHTRRYNVPILHRTYDCRHGKQLYTFYAIGLGTVAVPGIMKPGVIFPNFETTGRHTAHNPTRLIMEEAYKLWPGLRISCLLSIGTGNFGIDSVSSNPLAAGVSRACLEIRKVNEKLAEEMKRFVIPYDKQLAPVYFRFNLPTEHAYFENSAKEILQEDVGSWLKEARVATQCAYAADIIEADSFPTTAEDFVALASLASLLQALLVAGYTHEAAIVSDTISNFILYESALTETGSFRKLNIASEVEKIRNLIADGTRETHDRGRSNEPVGGLHSEAATLIGLMAFGDDSEGGLRASGPLQTMSDYAAAAYYVLNALRRGDQSQLERARFRNISRQLSSAISVPTHMVQQFSTKLEALLEIAGLGALCEAGNLQYLRGIKGLTYNGSLIKRIDHVLRSTSLKGFGSRLIEPFSNMLSLSIYSTNWSSFRDDAIITLLDAASVGGDANWSLVNLAVERYRQGQDGAQENAHNSEILSACEIFLDGQERAWATEAAELLETCVRNGWFGLLSKWLGSESLAGGSKISLGNDFANKAERAIRQAVQSGFPYIMKMIVEALGMERCKHFVNRANSQGQTALHLACKHRAPKEVFRLLYILGTNVNSQCHLGRTPMHYCVPDSKSVPPVFEEVVKIISDHSLPTITSLEAPQAWDKFCNARFIDSRAYDFRVLIYQLLAYNADMTIPDQEGMTPIHRAAKEGWTDTIDVFFRHEHGDSERLQRTSLRIRDHAGHTALDYTRMRGNIAGEEVLASEMRKRAMEIPPRPALHLLPMDPQDLPMKKFTIGKPRSPVPRAPSPLEVPESQRISQPTGSPQLLPDISQAPSSMVQFPPQSPPLSVQSPRQTPASNASFQSTPRFPSPTVYVFEDPEFSNKTSYAQASSSKQENPAPPSASQSRTSAFSQNSTLSQTSTLTPSMLSDFKDPDKQSMKSNTTFNSKSGKLKSKLRNLEKLVKKK